MTAQQAPVAMSTDVALVALKARADMAEDILARTDGTVLHVFVHLLQRAYEVAIGHLTEGRSVSEVIRSASLAGLIVRGRDSMAFLAQSDIVSVLSGVRLPESRAER